MRLAKDSSLLVEENLTFEYEGEFRPPTGTSRCGPARPSATSSSPRAARSTSSGGCTSFGCTDAENRYGVTPEGSGIRIVWHHKASDEDRTFTVRYRVAGLRKGLRRHPRHLLEGLGRPVGGQARPPRGDLHRPLASSRVRRRPRSLLASGATPGSTEARPRWSRAARCCRSTTCTPHQFVEMRVVVPRAPGRERQRRGGREGGRASEDPGRGGRGDRGLQQRAPEGQAVHRQQRGPDLDGPRAPRPARAARVHAARARARGRIGAEAPARAAGQRLPRARLRTRPRGRRQRRHGAGDPARPRRPRLLRGEDRRRREGEARPFSEGRIEAAIRQARAPREGGPELLRRAARGRHRGDERDEGPDSRAQRHLARALGDDDLGAQLR